MDELVTRLVKKGQPLTHIYAEHENERPVCLRTLYNYIDEGALSIKNIELRRKTGYKPRKKKYNDINGFHSKALMSLLKMHLIPPDEVHLMPDLFVKK